MSMNISSINNRSNFNIYSQLSSGKRINRAADDAAGLAIAQKLLKHETGLNVGAQNTREGMGALNVADGAMGGIMDYLQRIDELSIRSMNGLYSDSDRQAFQAEINGMMDGIQSLAKNTSLNEQKLLDGSMADMHLATNPSGGGMSIQLVDTTLQSLGIADFDVTKDFDLNSIKNAMDKVSSARSSMGASANGLEHVINYNNLASQNLTASRSRMEDTDVGEAITKLKTNNIMDHFKFLLSKQNQKHRMNLMGSML